MFASLSFSFCLFEDDASGDKLQQRRFEEVKMLQVVEK